MTIGKLERVHPRDLWKHEEHDFTRWLEQNLDHLGEELDLELTVVQREKSAGDFQVDLVAEDSGGNLVVIENQLEATNHDHLGKVLTYLTNLEAKTGIWIATKVRPEHIRAITWLNESTPEDVSFYLVRLEGIRIGNSDPAPLFSLIIGPTAETREVGEQKKTIAQGNVLVVRFWQGLLERAKEKGVLYHSDRSPWKNHWLSAGIGRAGIQLNYVVWREEQTAVELYIDVGDQAENKRIFDDLLKLKSAIERDFGAGLGWERLDHRRGSRIRHTLSLGGLNVGEKKWPEIYDAMIDAMDRFAKSLKPHEKAYLRA